MPFRRIDIEYAPWSGLLGLLQLRTTAGTSTGFEPPWPRLVISAGLGNEPVARWIQKQSGGRTRLVFLGRTWARTSSFDLLVTTPQYRVPRAANVIENPLTLHAVHARRLAAARAHWRSRFEGLEGMRVAVLLGGSSGPYAFDARFAERLAAQLNQFANEARISYLLSSSSRTPAAFLSALEQRLQGEHFVHHFGSSGENPYFGILAWADLIVVSADSIAMISEALATGKKVLLTEPSVGGSVRAAIYRSAMSWGHRRWTRDVALVHRALADAGLVGWLDHAGDRAAAAIGAVAGEPPGQSYLRETAAKVLNILD